MQNIEAQVYGQYLIGQAINNATIGRYHIALSKLDYQAQDWEHKVVEVAVRKPYLIPYFDAAMALRHRNALLRKKIFVMLAILETRPEYADFFLNRKYSKYYFLKILGIGFRAMYRAAIGLVIYRMR